MKPVFKTTGLAALLLAASTLTSVAETTVTTWNNEKGIFAVDGYLAAAGSVGKVGGGDRTYSLFDSQNQSFDAVKLGIKGQYEFFEGYLSAMYIPELTSGHSTRNGTYTWNGGSRAPTDSEAGIVEAFVKINVPGTGLSLTVGKYITPLGYEAFHTIDNALITGGYDGYGLYDSHIPAVHTGVRLDFVNKYVEAGAGIVDSTTAGYGFWEGDGDIGNGVGVEAYVKYVGTQRLKLFAGLAYDYRNNNTKVRDTLCLDFWGSYDISKSVSIGGEFVFGDDKGVKGEFEVDGTQKNPRPTYSWILFAKFTTPGHLFLKEDNLSIAARISGIHTQKTYAEDSNVPCDVNVFKFSLAPTYTFNKYLSFRVEGSVFSGEIKNKYAHTTHDLNGWFIGAQALLKF